MADAESILTARAVELEAIDNTVIGEVVGVSQSIGDLRKALDVLEGLLGERQFEKAAALGYPWISPPPSFSSSAPWAGYRALISIAMPSPQASRKNCNAPTKMARTSKMSARLECLKPRPNLTDEEHGAAKARFQRRLKEMASTSKG